MKRTRVLVVDDSAFARRVMRDVLVADGRVEVVGHARDGIDALEKIEELRPDVVTLDLVMPELDGVGVLDALRGRPGAPAVIVVSTSHAESPLGAAALTAGAFDLIEKPTALATDRLYEIGKDVAAKVVLAATARKQMERTPVPPAVAPPPPASASERHERGVAPVRTRIVVIGASTGGPRALALLLRELPATFPVPIAVVVHMPPGYTEAFAQRLDTECAVRVDEARLGMLLGPGQVVVARAGMHLRVSEAGGSVGMSLDIQPTTALHRPSVDVLFASAAKAFGRSALGVVLTGMGDDGLAGARAMKSAGGRVIVEDASSCVVYGMPRAVADAGLADARIPLERMASEIHARL